MYHEHGDTPAPPLPSLSRPGANHRRPFTALDAEERRIYQGYLLAYPAFSAVNIAIQTESPPYFFHRKVRRGSQSRLRKNRPHHPRASAMLRRRCGIGGVRTAAYPRRGIMSSSLNRRLNR